jgi:hypothetical protein
VIARRLLIFVVALLLAAEVVRNAAVAALADLHPADAARVWSNHPSVELSLGMTEIGRASRARTGINPAMIAIIDAAAVKAPLSPDPFLVHGVRAQLAGELGEARQDFAAAQWRDPRSLPAAYFLSDFYLRSGRPIEGLKQASILARLSPGGASTIAPFVAVYARSPGNWPQIRALFRTEPAIEDEVLAALAREPANAPAVLALADANHRKPDSLWVPALMHSLIGAGEYAQAHTVWASVAGVRSSAESLLYDAEFSSAAAPPPFNWTLTSSTVGMAEREPGHRLHVLFYGQEDGVLASQLLLLPAGTYHLAMQLAPGTTHQETLSWSVRCDKSTEPFASIAIDAAAARGWNFQVPSNCPAQWLELLGRSGDIAQQAEATIGALSLSRSGRGA